MSNEISLITTKLQLNNNQWNEDRNNYLQNGAHIISRHDFRHIYMCMSLYISYKAVFTRTQLHFKHTLDIISRIWLIKFFCFLVAIIPSTICVSVYVYHKSSTIHSAECNFWSSCTSAPTPPSLHFPDDIEASNILAVRCLKYVTSCHTSLFHWWHIHQNDKTNDNTNHCFT